jgi:hypothetical protein
MRTIRTLKKRKKFLQAMSAGASVAAAALAAGMSRRAAYEWREAEPDFAADWDVAQEQGTDALEDEARRRAAEGTDEPVFYQGKACGAIRKYSDTLLIFLLKARRPEKFRENPPPSAGGIDTLRELLAESRKQWERENATT